MTSRLLVASLFLAAASAYAARPVQDAADYTVLTGRVTIKTYGAHMIGIAVEERGAPLHLFRLWSADTLAPLSAVVDEASIEFRTGELVVMGTEPRLFYVFGTAESRFTAPRPPAGYTGAQYVGYGLNHEIRSMAAPKSRRVIALDDCPDCLFTEDPGPGLVCDAGGEGATSCSVSGCSVTCSSGYYACCNSGAVICKCVKAN